MGMIVADIQTIDLCIKKMFRSRLQEHEINQGSVMSARVVDI